MKDYSEKFKEPQSFIKKITIDKDNNEIKVTYSKGTTLRYPLTEENIDLFYQRLARQYSVTDQNVNHVVKNKIK